MEASLPGITAISKKALVIDRPLLPGTMFRDYVEGAIKRAKRQEKLDEYDKADAIYRRIISFGRQVLDEPGGLQFLQWGIAFQKRGAEELLQLHKITGSPQQKEIEAFLILATRRLNLLTTAFNCLDDMADFRSLKAAIAASRRGGRHLLQAVGRQYAGDSLTEGCSCGAGRHREDGYDRQSCQSWHAESRRRGIVET